MQLPETFDWRVFILHGRETTEAQVLGLAADEFIKQARHSDDLARLRSAIMVSWFRLTAVEITPTQKDFYFLGALRGALARGAFRGLRSLVWRAIAAYLDWEVKRTGGAGFSLEWLAFWQVTGEIEQLKTFVRVASGHVDYDGYSDGELDLLAREVDIAKQLAERVAAEDSEFARYVSTYKIAQ